MLAAECGNLESLRLLIHNDPPADLNMKNADKYTALLLASQLGNEVVVNELLSQDLIDVEWKNKFGKNALILAAENGHLSSLKLLLLKGHAKVDELSLRGLSALMLACVKGHIEVVSFLISPQGGANVLLKTNSTVSECRLWYENFTFGLNFILSCVFVRL